MPRSSVVAQANPTHPVKYLLPSASQLEPYNFLPVLSPLLVVLVPQGDSGLSEDPFISPPNPGLEVEMTMILYLRILCFEARAHDSSGPSPKGWGCGEPLRGSASSVGPGLSRKAPVPPLPFLLERPGVAK